MNQTEQMREALRLGLAALKNVRHVDQQHSEAERAIEQALASKPAKLVRLTDGEIDKLDCVEIEYGFYGEYWISSKSVKDFAHAIMDAMQEVNKCH